MKYIESIVSSINNVISNKDNLLIYGENINYGSCIGGLGRGLKLKNSSKIINVQNSELTHVGIGLGMMLDNGNSILFVKQLDFMLLALDQICNTYNLIRATNKIDNLGSFTIVSIVCDHGFQGAQSSLNASADFSSLANIPIFCLNNYADITEVISSKLVSNGFRILTLSQRAFTKNIIINESLCSTKDKSIFKYLDGENFTLVCINFALSCFYSEILDLHQNKLKFDLFHINYLPHQDFELIINSVKKTKCLLILDDTKSHYKLGDSIVSQIVEQKVEFTLKKAYRKQLNDKEYGVNNDSFEISIEDLIKDFL